MEQPPKLRQPLDAFAKMARAGDYTGLVAEAIAKARLEALEQAARLVETWNFMACSDADALAHDIRALAQRVKQ